MANGYYENRTPRQVRNRKRKLALLLSLILLMGTAIGGTLAYLISDSSQVTNSFIAGHVDCVVEKNGNEYTVRPSVEMDQNIGKKATNTNIYLRVAIVANWVDAEGVYWEKPNVTVSGNKWVPIGDYWYYKNEVVPNGAADVLTVTISETRDGYTPQIQVLAEAIQAEGENAAGKTPVELAWGSEAAQTVGAIS